MNTKMKIAASFGDPVEVDAEIFHPLMVHKSVDKKDYWSISSINGLSLGIAAFKTKKEAIFWTKLLVPFAIPALDEKGNLTGMYSTNKDIFTKAVYAVKDGNKKAFRAF